MVKHTYKKKGKSTFLGFVTINSGETCIVERFGKFSNIPVAGLTWLTPLAEKIVYRHTDAQFSLDIAPQHVLSKDGQTFSIDANIICRITDHQQACYNVTNPYVAITDTIMSIIRTEICNMDLMEVNSNREKLNHRVLTLANDEALSKEWGIKVVKYETQKVNLPEEITRQLERLKVSNTKAESERIETENSKTIALQREQMQLETSQLQEEREKIVAIKRAEKQAELSRIQAQSELDQQRINNEKKLLDIELKNNQIVSVANSQKQAQLLNSQANAESIKMVSEAENDALRKRVEIINSAPGFIQMEIAKVNADAFGKFAKESTTVFMPTSSIDTSMCSMINASTILDTIKRKP